MAQNKETTYQRLKRENMELKQKLAILASAPESEAGRAIKSEVKIRVGIENAAWAGDVTGPANEGLLKQMATW